MAVERSKLCGYASENSPAGPGLLDHASATPTIDAVGQRLVADGKRVCLDHGLKRLARSDPEAALHAWKALQQRFTFPASQIKGIGGHLALRLARSRSPDAMGYLDSFQPGPQDLALGEARVRAALALGDWAKALSWIDALPGESRAQERWR